MAKARTPITEGYDSDDVPPGARLPVTTVRRRLGGRCVTNFYPISFGQPSSSGGASGSGSGARRQPLQIRIFHCSYRDVDADEPIRPREESELKRRIFEAPRHDGRQRAVEDALGVRCLEFGGDCAAGLCGDRRDEAESENEEADEMVIDAVDRYEANHGGDWLPAVVRELPLEDGPNENALVELYAPGSFWSEALNRTGPVEVPMEGIRPRHWEVYRGEALRVPDGEELRIRAGQHLWVRPRGPAHEEPAGRLVLGLGSRVYREPGGVVENEGVLECTVALQHLQQGMRRYKVEIESIKTLLVECLEGIPDLPQEERGVVLQSFTWIFERAYRRMKMRTLGGRGWYLAEEGERYPQTFTERPPDREQPPWVYLYKGFAASAVQVARGPCLKVDLSVRMIQGQTALAKLSFFRDMVIQKHQTQGLPAPTKDEMDAFMQKQMQGRTCMTKHNHVHYRINRVCLDMDATSTFPFEDGEISYMEYFQRRHGIALTRRQPLLHCPFRGKQELYLPAEIAFLTGLDDDWRGDREYAQELWRSLRHDPTEHWRLQSRLTDGLASEDNGAALREWGVSVSREPLKVAYGQLEHEPVYFSRYSHEYFRRARLPPEDLEVLTTQHGFEQVPWPEVWTPPGHRIVFDRWLIFCDSSDRELVDRFVEELEPLVGEILEADLNSNRIVIALPEIVEVPLCGADDWAEKIEAHKPPWPARETKLALVIIPDRRRDQYYYSVKNRLSFGSATTLLSQVVLSSTLHRPNQRMQIWKNLLQQIMIKRGAWMWVISPLPYRGRSMMVVGIDASKQSRDSPTTQVLCATMNPYFTQCYSTWRRAAEAPREHGAPKGSSAVPPGELFKEACLSYFVENGRLPDTVVVYRGGVSESQEAILMENEVYHPEGGILQTLVQIAEEVDWSLEEVTAWKARLEIAYIVVRRGTSARLCTEDGDNMPSGSYVDDEVVARREDVEGGADTTCFDFYMVSQSFVVGTAKPVLYSVLYNTLTLTRIDVIQLTYRLCAVYQTFSGMVSAPAPLKYASKLVSYLSKCDLMPAEPPSSFDKLRPWLFYL